MGSSGQRHRLILERNAVIPHTVILRGWSRRAKIQTS